MISLEYDYPPRDVDQQIGEYVRQHNYRWVHESLDNMTPADVYLDLDKIDKNDQAPEANK